MLKTILMTFLLLQAAFAQQQAQRTGPRTKERLREEYFSQPRTYPLGFIPAQALEEASRAMDRMTVFRHQRNSSSRHSGDASSTVWTSIGAAPTTRGTSPNTSGWTSALAVDPRNPLVAYAGSPGGGVWKTTDGAISWTSLTDTQATNVIGSIALAPSNPDVVYVGTGNPTYTYGAGVLKSTNAGASWTLLGGPFQGPTGPTTYFDGGAKIASIVVDPNNPNNVLAGVFRWPLSGGGIYRSTDGGVSWTQVLFGGRCLTLRYDLAVTGTVWASVGEYYSQAANGVYKSTDNGATWTKMNGSGTTALPVSNSWEVWLTQGANPNSLYVAIGNTSGTTNGVYKSVDNGISWNKLTLPSALGSRQVQVTAAPQSSNVVYVGDIVLYRSLDGGSTWTNVRGNTFADYRSFAWAAGGTRLYVGDDGGVWTTTAPTTGTSVTWQNGNTNLNLALWYPGMSLHPTDINTTLVGAQDQGVQKYSGTTAWAKVKDCDGGWTVIDPTNPSTMYADCENVQIFKSTTGGALNSWSNAQSGIPTSEAGIFIPPLIVDKLLPSTLYYGLSHIYQTTNGAASWTSISPNLGGSSTTIAVAPSDSNTVYTATGNGKLWVTRNASAGASSTWTDRSGNGLPNRSFSNLAIDPTNPAIAYATVSGFTFGTDTAGHVFSTTNAGVTWFDISSNLPNTPANDIAVDQDLPGTLYLGTDVGMFYSTNAGASWAVLASGLPRVIVTSVRLHRPSRTLRVGTFGRGAWDLSVPATTSNPPPVVTSISPSNATAGGPGFNLTVNGSGFITGSTVLWNGSARTTTFIGSTSMTATIPAADIAAAGTYSVSVTSPAPGGGTSNSVPFTATSATSNSPPTVTSVSPAFGNATSTVRTFVFNDPDGAGDLNIVNVLINFSLDGRNACYLAYDAKNSALYLVQNDGGTLQGMGLPSTGTLFNSQCRINGTGTSAVKTGTSLTLTVDYTFFSAFAGDHTVYAAARDTAVANSGWQPIGTHRVPGVTAFPYVLDATPNSGTAFVGVAQTFTLRYQDAAASTNLQPVQMLINNALDGRNACYFGFDHAGNYLYLINDVGTTLQTGPIRLNGAAGAAALVENASCQLVAAGSTFSESGQILTINLNVVFKSSLAGRRLVYAGTQTLQGANSNWQLLGNLTVQ